MPCRMCEVAREDMMNSDIELIRKRESQWYKEVLETAWPAFCRYVTAPGDVRTLSDRDREVLDFCRAHSIYPIYPAFYELESSFEGHTVYDQFPPDVLHTLIGLLEFWVSMVITIIAKIGKLLDRPHRISHLEQMLQMFPYKQTMPYRVRHITNGLASIVPGKKCY